MADRHLTQRIAATTRDLAALDAERRRSNAALDRILADLETRFASRTAECDHVRARIAPLAHANRTLADLADRLAGVAERFAAADEAATTELAARLAGALPPSAAPRFEDVGAEELAREDAASS